MPLESIKRAVEFPEIAGERFPLITDDDDLRDLQLKENIRWAV